MILPNRTTGSPRLLESAPGQLESALSPSQIRTAHKTDTIMDKEDEMNDAMAMLMEEFDEESDDGGEFDDADEDSNASIETNVEERRPFDDWIEAGPPVDPPPFDWKPRILNGGRERRLCFGLEGTGDRGAVVKVLLRYPAEVAEFAYLPVREKKPIKTIMGHLQIHHVLRAVKRWNAPDEEDIHDVDEVENDRAMMDEVAFELTPDVVAIKVNLYERMEQLRNSLSEDPMKEITAMQLVARGGAQHVLGCSEVIYDANTQTLNVVMKYCRQGDMFDLIREVHLKHRVAVSAGMAPQAQGAGLSERQARFWIFQIVRGLQELRNVGVCHRDLSPENIMMDANNALVIDLGLCLRVPYFEEPSSGQTVETILRNRENRLFAWRRLLTKPQGAVGKLPYMSPEIYLNRHPFDGEMADVWSLGTILFCMLTGQQCYEKPDPSNLKFRLISSELEMVLHSLDIVLTPEGYDLLSNMLQISPRDRLTLDEVASHPWFDLPAEAPGAPNDA